MNSLSSTDRWADGKSQLGVSTVLENVLFLGPEELDGVVTICGVLLQ